MLNRVLVVGALLIAAAPVFAGPTATPRINHRQVNQERRIDQGVASGALTARETHTLDAREARIAADKAAAKADGTVTHAERAQLRGEERRTSRAIYRKKHNGRVASPPAG
jgi:uncharacterized membrane protein YebE (DUF533 family)